MKIGVALSGCGIGDLTIYCALSQLKNSGIDISHISASRGLTLPALLFACGCPEEEALDVLRQKYRAEQRLVSVFWRIGWQRSLKHLLRRMKIYSLADFPIAVSIVAEDKRKGCITCFSSLQGEENAAAEKRWSCFLEPGQKMKQIFRALYPVMGSGAYGDPTYRIGYPTYPLKFDGAERMLCMGFTGAPRNRELLRQNEMMCGVMRQVIRNDSQLQLCLVQPEMSGDADAQMRALEQLGRSSVDEHLLALYDAILF